MCAGRIGVFKMFWAKYADRKSTRLNSSHRTISYAVFCLKKKTQLDRPLDTARLDRLGGAVAGSRAGDASSAGCRGRWALRRRRPPAFPVGPLASRGPTIA